MSGAVRSHTCTKRCRGDELLGTRVTVMLKVQGDTGMLWSVLPRRMHMRSQRKIAQLRASAGCHMPPPLLSMVHVLKLPCSCYNTTPCYFAHSIEQSPCYRTEPMYATYQQTLVTDGLHAHVHVWRHAATCQHVQQLGQPLGVHLLFA